jgi:hypothetical protein
MKSVHLILHRRLGHAVVYDSLPVVGLLLRWCSVVFTPMHKYRGVFGRAHVRKLIPVLLCRVLLCRVLSSLLNVTWGVTQRIFTVTGTSLFRLLVSTK